MTFWRIRIGWIAAVTLALQIGAIASAATALCCGPFDDAPMRMACCENPEPGHVCPMPKKPKPGEPTIQSCCDLDARALAVFFVWSGTLDAPDTTLATPRATIASMSTAEQPIALVRPPDSPPPRG